MASEEGGNIREQGISETWERMSRKKEFQSYLLSESFLGGQIRYDRVALDLVTQNLLVTFARADATK